MKKIIAVVLTAIIIACQIPQIVFADTPVVTVENTLGDYLANYTIDDLLSGVNYENYFDDVDNGLKYCINYNAHYVNNVNTSYLPSAMWDLVSGAYDSPTFGTVEFHPDAPEDSLKFFMFFVGPSYTPLCETVSVVPQNSDYKIAFVDGRLICNCPYDIYWCDYRFTFNTTGTPYTVSYSGYLYQGDYKHHSTISTVTQNNTYETDYNNPSYFLYSEIPFYFTYQSNQEYPDMSYLSQSPYNYNQYINIYNAIGTDTTGFVIDRRTDKMINGDNNDTNDEIIQDGFDPLLFNGTLGFNWFKSSGSTNYVSSLNQYKPFVQLKYKINNYTDIHKDDVSIIWDSTISMKLTYDGNNDSTRFITSCKYDASGTWDLVGHENQFTLLASQESNLYTLRNVRSTSGTNPYGNEFRSNQNINQNITYGISAYHHDNDIVTNSEEDAYNFVRTYFDNNNKGNDTLDSYGFIYFNVYLKNSTTGETSKIYSSVFDLFNNKFQDNSGDLVNNDDSAYSDFVNSFNYLDQDGNLSPVDYAKPYNNNNSANGGQAIVTITNPQFPYLLVDIPEGDWMNKTPNLTNILGDFKNALEEVHDESILPVMAQTYNYLPADMWRYLVYGVELLLMVGIWRGITRR